jgi:hypothetical protein
MPNPFFNLLGGGSGSFYIEPDFDFCGSNLPNTVAGSSVTSFANAGTLGSSLNLGLKSGATVGLYLTDGPNGTGALQLNAGSVFQTAGNLPAAWQGDGPKTIAAVVRITATTNIDILGMGNSAARGNALNLIASGGTVSADFYQFGSTTKQLVVGQWGLVIYRGYTLNGTFYAFQRVNTAPTNTFTSPYLASTAASPLYLGAASVNTFGRSVRVDIADLKGWSAVSQDLVEQYATFALATYKLQP